MRECQSYEEWVAGIEEDQAREDEDRANEEEIAMANLECERAEEFYSYWLRQQMGVEI